MHNLTTETKRVVTANFSADQWGLYTTTFPRDEIEDVATKLNTRLNDYVNEDYTKAQTMAGMHDIMLNYKYYGAYDSEVRGFLDMVLDEIYK
jgi:hypothetical protein